VTSITTLADYLSIVAGMIVKTEHPDITTASTGLMKRRGTLHGSRLIIALTKLWDWTLDAAGSGGVPTKSNWFPSFPVPFFFPGAKHDTCKRSAG
jgi:hypothetical protein